MTPYVDSGVLVKLWVLEDLSDAVTALVKRRGVAIPYTSLHDLEVRSALRAKVFRREVTRPQLEAALAAIDSDLASGRLFRPHVAWEAVFAECERASAETTVRHGGRVLDLLHVTLALHLGCTELISLDARQRAAAKALGLKVTGVSP